MKACVIGAGGVIGWHLCKALIDGGHHVVAITRNSAPPPELAAAYWFRLSDVGPVDFLIAMSQWDVIIDLRAYKCDDLKGLTEQACDLTSHWIHISTIYVYRRLSEALTTNTGEAFLPVPISEDTLCRPSGPYGLGKLDCERKWQNAHNKSGAPVTIVRLPFVYGPRDRSQRARFYIDRLLAKDVINLPSSGGCLIDLLFAEDLAHILIRLIRRSESIGQVYNIAARTAVPLRAHIESLAEALGVQAHISNIPGPEEIDIAPPYAYPVDILLDITRLFDLLGDVPAIPIQETWRRVVEWECLNKTFPESSLLHL